MSTITAPIHDADNVTPEPTKPVGANIRIETLTPRGTPSQKPAREPQREGGSQKLPEIAITRDIKEESEDTSPSTSSRPRQNDSRPVPTQEELQQQLDTLTKGYNEQTFGSLVRALKEQDAAAAHTVAQTVAQSFVFYTETRGFPEDAALRVIASKIRFAKKFFNENGATVKEVLEQLEQAAAELEQVREDILSAIGPEWTRKTFLEFVENGKDRKLYSALTQPISEELNRRYNNGKSPAAAIEELTKTIARGAATYEKFQGWVEQIKTRWDEIHGVDFAWVLNSERSRRLRPITRQAYDMPFDDAVQKYGYASVKRTIKAITELAEEGSEAFVSGGYNPSRSRRSRGTGGSSGSSSSSKRHPSGGAKDDKNKGEFGGNTPNARKRRRTAQAQGRTVTPAS
jgi:primosomal protein N''